MKSLLAPLFLTPFLLAALIAPAVAAPSPATAQTPALRPAKARTIYRIDPAKGNDSASGIGKAPWKSFAPLAAKTLQAGDVVLVSPGTLTSTLTINKAKGTLKNPVLVKFAPGRYTWAPDGLTTRQLMISNTNDDPNGKKRIAIETLDSTGITIDGTGADFFCGGKMVQLHISNTKNILLKGFSFDYIRPTVSEYTVKSANDQEAIINIHPDSTYRIDNGTLKWIGNGEEWDSGGFVQKMTRSPLAVSRSGGIGLNTGTTTETAPHTVTISYSKNPGYQAGATYQHRVTRRDYASVFCNNSTDITYDGVNFHFLHGMGVVSQFSRNITFRNMSIAPRPGAGRTCAAWADMLHFSGCSGTIRVNNVRFSGANDDAINVHGTHLRVTRIDSPTQITVRFMHGQTWGFPGFRDGDTVDFISAQTLNSLGLNKVTKAELAENGKDMTLTLAKPIPANIAVNKDVLENVTATPAVHVSNCIVELIPTRGFLLTTRRPMVIEKTTFTGTIMPAILVSDDANSWFESGMVKDLTIRNCTFTQCAEPVIDIHPENPTHGTPVHSGIRIINNTFNLRNHCAVGLKSAADVTIKGNTFAPSGEPASFVRQNNCENVSVK